MRDGGANCQRGFQHQSIVPGDGNRGPSNAISKDDLAGVEDGAAAEGVAEALLLDEVHVPAEEGDQFVAHLDQMEEVPRVIGLEAHEDIHVAVGPEVVAEDRAEQGELADPPLAAEGLDAGHRDIDIAADHATHYGG